jgi:CheY-like chemotaxis protein
LHGFCFKFKRFGLFKAGIFRIKKNGQALLTAFLVLSEQSLRIIPTSLILMDDGMEKKTILLVEDNPDDELLTIRAFEKNNLRNEVIIVRDGAEALDYLFGTGAYSDRDTRVMPQFILLNLHIPKIDGFEVLKRLRSDERTKLLPVVIFTASKEERDLLESYQLGSNNYIRKPLDFNQFAEKIRQLGLHWLVFNEVNLSDTTPAEMEKPAPVTPTDSIPPLSEVSPVEDDDRVLVINDVRARFSELISDMPEEEMQELIGELEKKHKPEPADHRKHVRNPSKIIVDFSIDNFPFTNFIQDISASGAFIETALPFTTDKELSMTFILPGHEDSVQITGKIVRTDSKGIGVQFDELLQEV